MLGSADLTAVEGIAGSLGSGVTEGTGTIDTCMKAEGRWLREDGRVFFCYRYK
jgi:hypothetical protein